LAIAYTKGVLKMINQNGGSRTDTLIKLVLVFFLSLLSFSVGTFVGKQFSDSQHKTAELEGGDADRTTASIPPEAGKPEVGGAISDEEIAKLADEFKHSEKTEKEAPAADTAVGQNDHGMEGEVVAKKETETQAEAKPATVKDEISEISKKLANGEKVEVAKAAPSKIPMKLPRDLASTSVGKFTVQVSSHSDLKEAEGEVKKLVEKGFAAQYYPADIKGKKWYRVCVGKFDDRKAATEFLPGFKQKAKVSSAIIQKIGN
jgi:septal ring-binding cell division protein DamX